MGGRAAIHANQASEALTDPKQTLVGPQGFESGTKRRREQTSKKLIGLKNLRHLFFRV